MSIRTHLRRPSARRLTEEIPIALFVAQHRHSPEWCPASAGSGPLLLSQVSAATAARYGVTIEAEALIDEEHLLLLVVQAASPEAVERFLAFLPDQGACGSCQPAPPKKRSSAAAAGQRRPAAPLHLHAERHDERPNPPPRSLHHQFQALFARGEHNGHDLQLGTPR